MLVGDSECKACELHESAQAVCLMGQGPVPADVMIIGEAPGFREDSVGTPFAGKSGQLLDKVLEESGLKRDRVYITNICKCRPPENRTPKAAEMKACRPFLDMELERVNPKFIILLGAVPTKAFLKKKITEVHGQVYEIDDKFYMPTFHPALALRDPRRLDPIHADFERFSTVIKTGKTEKPPKLNLTIINTFDEFNDLIKDIKRSREVSWDLETTSLDWFRKEEKINCMGLATKNRQWILPLEIWLSKFKGKHSLQKDMMEIIADAMKGKKVIAHNAKFDNIWIRSRYGVRFPVTFDTILASHILDENSPNSLNYLSKAFFKAPDYDLPIADKVNPETKKKVHEMFEYCGYDVFYTLKLYYLFRRKLKEDVRLLRVFTKMVMPLVRIYEDVELEGITIDTDKLDIVEKELLRDITKTEKKLKEYTEGREVNWNSPQQVAEVLFEDWKLNPVKKTPSGADSTDESVLKMLAKKHQGVKVLLEYRALHKQYSGFVKSWKDRMVEGKLHPSYKLNGTVTGRPSCGNPNLQQTPRESKIRSLIHAPPGWELVEADQSQIELRVAAMLSGERTMKFIFQTKGDIHTSTAQEVSDKEVVTKDERKKAKAVNFGFIYGMGWKKFMDYARDKYGVELSPAQARSYRKRYFEKYADLPRWHERQRSKARMYQEVRTLTGRLRRLPSVLSTDEGIRAEAERQSINSPVQGFAAEITLMGLIAIWEYFDRKTVRAVGTVHDSVLMLVKKDKVDEVLPKVKELMENPPLLEEFEINMTVPLIAEATVGPWGAGKEYEFSE